MAQGSESVNWAIRVMHDRALVSVYSVVKPRFIDISVSRTNLSGPDFRFMWRIMRCGGKLQNRKQPQRDGDVVTGVALYCVVSWSASDSLHRGTFNTHESRRANSVWSRRESYSTPSVGWWLPRHSGVSSSSLRVSFVFFSPFFFGFKVRRGVCLFLLALKLIFSYGFGRMQPRTLPRLRATSAGILPIR